MAITTTYKFYEMYKCRIFKIKEQIMLKRQYKQGGNYKTKNTCIVYSPEAFYKT